MKKFLILLISSILTLSAVGCTKDEATSTETPSVQTETSQQSELHLEKEERFYVNAEYFKALSLNKSATDAQSTGILARTQHDISTGDYTITLGDLHQGGTNYIYSKTIYYENEKREDVIYESEGKEAILSYFEEDDTYRIFGNHPAGRAIDEEFVSFEYYIDFYEKATDIVIGTSPNIKKEEDKIYVHVDGITYQLLISPDSTIDSQESSKMMEEGARGYVYLLDETDKDSDNFLADKPVYYYFTEGESFIIKNSDGEIITTLSLE